MIDRGSHECSQNTVHEPAVESRYELLATRESNERALTSHLNHHKTVTISLAMREMDF